MTAPIGDQTSEWGKTFAHYADELNERLPHQTEARRYNERRFRRYRRHALNRFRQVDDALRKVCGELSKVRDPLNEILVLIPSLSHEND